MNKNELRQVIENIEFPDAAFLPPEEVIIRYSFIIDLLGATTADRLHELSEVIDNKIEEDTKKYNKEDENIYNAILSGKGNQSISAYTDNEKNKEVLIMKLLPFAFYVREKARALALDKINQDMPNIESGFRNIQKILSKYHVQGCCSSIMVLQGEKENNEYVFGQPKDILFMLSAAIKGHLESLRHTEYEETIDEYLIELAGNMLKPETDRKCITIYPTRKEKYFAQPFISQISDEIDNDYYKICKYMETASINNTAYVICIKNQNNVKCLLGGDRKRIRDIFSSIIKALIRSGYKHYERFNDVAIAIKDAFEATKEPIKNMETANV